MADDNFAGVVKIIQRVEENFGVVVKVPVVRKGNRARVNHVAQLGKLLPFLPFGDRADNLDVDDTDLLGTVNHRTNQSRIVDNGRSVRHRRNRRETACRRRFGAAHKVFLSLLPRLAQVHMHID